MIDLLATLVVLLVCTWAAARYIRGFRAEERSLLWLSFVAHQAAGLINIGITNYYYKYGDMISYFKFGVTAAHWLHDDFWGLAPGLVGLILHRPDPLPIPLETLSTSSGAMQGVSAFAAFFLFDSLYAICALIAGCAFLSKLALYRLVSEELPDVPRRPLLLVCTLLPSALFWSCSLLKEPLAMIGALLAICGWHRLLYRRRRFQAVAFVVVGCSIVIFIKGYMFPALGLAAGAWYVARKIHDRRGDITFKAGHVVIGVVAAAVLIVATGALLPQFGAEALTDQLAGLQTVGAETDGGSNYSLGQSAGSSSSQAALAPLGLVTALFRPFLFEVKAPIVLMGALETSCFLVAAVLVLLRRGILASFSELIRRPFLSFCAMFTLVFGTCVGLATTNMGTLSRYRMPLTPFFATLLLALIARAPARVEIARVAPRVRTAAEVP